VAKAQQMASNISPVIGITLSLDHGVRISPPHEYVYVKRAYAKAVMRAGGRPVHISPELDPAAVANICQALVISGGDDIPADLYGDAMIGTIHAESRERIAWERQLLDAFGQAQVPVLGVCYGMQLINVHYGGKLIQDIRAANPTALDHGGGGRATEHDITITPGSFLAPLFGTAVSVSSTHHQAVAPVASGFTVAARASDGTVEAIERGSLLAVEWHPEADTTGEHIYRMLVERARKVCTGP
jgi:putative glutamine amidotransferase